MQWSQISPVLLSILSEIAVDKPIEGAPAFQAQWADRAREMASPDYQHALFVAVTTVEGVQEDEQRFGFDANARDEAGNLGVVTATNCGMRRINLQLRSECYENTDDNWCMAVLDRIYTRMGRTRYIERMRDECNAAWIDSGVAHSLPVPSDGHILSAGTLDLILYAAVNDVDPVPYGWIERVRLTSHIVPKLDITNKLLPPA